MTGFVKSAQVPDKMEVFFLKKKHAVGFGSWLVINFNSVGSNENLSSKSQLKMFPFSVKPLHRLRGKRKHRPYPPVQPVPWE